MDKKQVLVYRVLESTIDLRSVFVGHVHFTKFMKFQKLIKAFCGNFYNSTVSVKYFSMPWPEWGTPIWMFLYNDNTQKPF